MDLKEIASIITAIGALISALTAAIKAFRIQTRPKILSDAWFWVSIILFLVLTSITTWLIIDPCTDPTKFGFENGDMGWTPETYADSQGITTATQSTEQAKVCKHSLKLSLDLEGSHPNRSKGEVYIEIPPQNLTDKPITVWVYVPKDAIGSRTKPNGIQVFVKDKDLKYEYGVWWDITLEKVGNWQPVTLTPSSSPPSNISMESGFDPTQIRIIGVKIATGKGSTDKFKGNIYIDGIDWP